MTLMGCLMALVVIWPWVGPYDARAVGTEQYSAPNAQYWFGTDLNGRDMFSRVIYGTKISLFVGVTGAAFSVLVGAVWGGIAGFFGGRVDRALMRIVDVLYSLPTVIFVIAMVTAMEAWLNHAFGPEVALRWRIPILLMGIGAVSWLNMARVVRARAQSLSSSPFVEAARSLGLSDARLLFGYILPNCYGLILTYAVLTAPSVILYESFLSYLGLGVQAPASSLGSLIAEGAGQINPIRARWWMILFPALALMGLLGLAHVIGEGLKDAYAPQRGRGASLFRKG